MTEIMQTERLTLKPFCKEDAEALAAMLVHEDIRATYMIPELSTEEKKQRLVNRFFALSHDETHFVRGIYLDGTLIGFVNDVEMGEVMELGYVIHPAHWNRGYATEMLRAIIDHLEDMGVSCLKTGAFSENGASIRVMEKCGMMKTDETEIISYRGREHTCLYYEIKR